MNTTLWTRPVTPADINDLHRETACASLGIEFVEIGPDYMRATMPVDARTVQPYRILHGGASLLLAETLASCAAAFAAPPDHRVVGLEVNGNHLKSARAGHVTGTVRPVHVGRSTQVWQVEIVNDAGELCCLSRATLAVLQPAPD
ncbi:MAG: hotdog fold thioesterase [Gammaproteobacteria bacterium]|nr:hotdog fold thioesterase [Gammaproteobacteria bacterium]MCP5199785.1 hotdog fold thioesterase [Gammaproteobacteria bacterium]